MGSLSFDTRKNQWKAEFPNGQSAIYDGKLSEAQAMDRLKEDWFEIKRQQYAD